MGGRGFWLRQRASFPMSAVAEAPRAGRHCILTKKLSGEIIAGAAHHYTEMRPLSPFHPQVGGGCCLGLCGLLGAGGRLR